MIEWIIYILTHCGSGSHGGGNGGGGGSAW